MEAFSDPRSSTTAAVHALSGDHLNPSLERGPARTTSDEWDLCEDVREVERGGGHWTVLAQCEHCKAKKQFDAEVRIENGTLYVTPHASALTEFPTGWTSMPLSDGGVVASRPKKARRGLGPSQVRLDCSDSCVAQMLGPGPRYAKLILAFPTLELGGEFMRRYQAALPSLESPKIQMDSALRLSSGSGSGSEAAAAAAAAAAVAAQPDRGGVSYLGAQVDSSAPVTVGGKGGKVHTRALGEATYLEDAAPDVTRGDVYRDAYRVPEGSEAEGEGGDDDDGEDDFGRMSSTQMSNQIMGLLSADSSDDEDIAALNGNTRAEVAPIPIAALATSSLSVLEAGEREDGAPDAVAAVAQQHIAKQMAEYGASRSGSTAAAVAVAAAAEPPVPAADAAAAPAAEERLRPRQASHTPRIATQTRCSWKGRQGCCRCADPAACAAQ